MNCRRETADMTVLPGVLACSFGYAQDKLTLRRTVQVRNPTPCGCPVAHSSPRSRDENS
jgi:hypothetical protein